MLPATSVRRRPSERLPSARPHRASAIHRPLKGWQGAHKPMIDQGRPRLAGARRRAWCISRSLWFRFRLPTLPAYASVRSWRLLGCCRQSRFRLAKFGEAGQTGLKSSLTPCALGSGIELVLDAPPDEPDVVAVDF